MAPTSVSNDQAPPPPDSDLKSRLFLPANVANQEKKGERPGKHFVRRLSARDVQQRDLAFGKTAAVVIPESLIERLNGEGSSEDDEDDNVAFTMEHARQELEGIAIVSPEDNVPRKKTKVTDHYAFAFDIDGVLIRGGEPIPEAIEAMRMLNGKNSHGIKVPYIFLTNGGGKTEAERCIQLSKQLQITVSPGMAILF